MYFEIIREAPVFRFSTILNFHFDYLTPSLRQLFETLLNKPISAFTQQSPFTEHTPPFTFRAPPMPGLRWRNPQLSHITLRPGGGGRIYTPYNYIWKPSRSWFRARSKKSPWGDYTSSGHAFIPLLVCRDAPAYEIWYDMVGALPVW